MKKRLLALVLACATILSLVGCGNTASNDDTSKKPTNDTTVETESEKEPEIDQNAWKSGKFTFMGVEMEIGKTTLAEFKTAVEKYSYLNMNGETKYGSLLYYENIIQPHSQTNFNNRTSIDICADYNKIYLGGYVHVYNPTDTELNQLECKINDVKISYDNVNPYAILDVIENNGKFIDLVLPNGVTFGTSMYDVEKLYGQPTTIDADWYIYETDTFKILLNVKSNYVSEIEYLITDVTSIQ